MISYNDDIILLKQAVCLFFNKLLPSIIDPMQLVRQRWHIFRDYLLENNTSEEILNYVKSLNFGQKMSPLKQIDEEKDQFEFKPKLNIQIPNKDNEQKLKQRRFSENDQNENLINQIQEIPNKIKRMDSIKIKQTSNRSKLPEFNFMAIKSSGLASEIQQKVQEQLKTTIEIFQKNTRTLFIIHDKSNEIDTSDPLYQMKQNDQYSRQTEQDMHFLRSKGRKGTLRKFTVYAKQDSGTIKQLESRFAEEVEKTDNDIFKKIHIT